MILYSEDYWRDIAKVVEFVPNKNNLFNHSILITGANGMICSTVVELLHWMNHYLNANIHIFLAGRNEERMRKRFPFMNNDLHYSFIPYEATSSKKINVKADYIIHGASNADPHSFSEQPVETMLANFIGLNSLLVSAIENKSKRVLLVSSSEVYGKKEEKRPYNENDYGFVNILNPRACYPSSKRAAETLCAAYMEEYDLNFVTVRPGHIYGPSILDSDSRASAQFSRNAKMGIDIILKSAGSQLRSYCYTMDCASAILSVLINGKCGEAYNISNPKSIVSIREMAMALANAGHVKIVFEKASEIEQKSYNLMDNSSLESLKLERLGWKAVFNIKDGAENTLKYLQIR